MTYSRVETGTSDAALATAERLADAAFSIVEQKPYRGGTEWLTEIQCADVDPEIFHPVSPFDVETIDKALSICDSCPVHAACRARRYDLGADNSVWGGVYYPPGARGRRPCALAGCTKAPRRNSDFCSFEHAHAVKVGTTAGYKLHSDAGIKACPSCTEAQRAAREVRRIAERSGGGARAYQGGRSGARVAER